MHEIIHALGFIDILFPEYFDSVTNMKYSDSQIYKNEKGYNVLNTPRLNATLQKYFGCNDIEGTLMEN